MSFIPVCVVLAVLKHIPAWRVKVILHEENWKKERNKSFTTNSKKDLLHTVFQYYCVPSCTKISCRQDVRSAQFALYVYQQPDVHVVLNHPLYNVSCSIGSRTSHDHIDS